MTYSFSNFGFYRFRTTSTYILALVQLHVNVTETECPIKSKATVLTGSI